MTVMSLQKDNGLPPVRLQTPIDALCLGLHFTQEFVIAPDVRAAGSPNLDKSKFSFVSGITVEEPLDRQKTFENPFRVIDAINTHAHIERLYAQLFEQGFTLRAGRARAWRWSVFLGRGHADRKRPHHGQVPFTVHGKSLPLNAGLDSAVYSLEKVVTMGLNVKANQVGAQQSIEQLALPRTDTEGLWIGPWNVPENRYLGVRTLALNELWQQGKVIILNEQHRVLGVCHLFEHGFGEFLVDIPIMLPIRCPKQWSRMGDMAERPQPFVGKAVIIPFFLFLAEPHAT